VVAVAVMPVKFGAVGGGEVGQNGSNSSGGTQTAGGGHGGGASGGVIAGFGFGGWGENNVCGGGGGWYGGGAGYTAGGGSGYVLTASSYKPAGYRLSSEYYLSNAQTIAGNQSFPAPGGGSETGHSGNGYARITLIE